MRRFKYHFGFTIYVTAQNKDSCFICLIAVYIQQSMLILHKYIDINLKKFGFKMRLKLIFVK